MYLYATVSALAVYLSAFGCGGGSDSNVMRDTLNLGGFCGWSTDAECGSDGKCIAGGCNGELCQHYTEMIGTVCMWQDCFRDENYQVKCGCVEGKCSWYNEVPRAVAKE